MLDLVLAVDESDKCLKISALVNLPSSREDIISSGLKLFSSINFFTDGDSLVESLFILIAALSSVFILFYFLSSFF